MDELLAKYMLGEASAVEIATIESWMAADEKNRRYFNHFKLIWETSKTLQTESKLDVDASWDKFKELKKSAPATNAAVKTMPKRNSWMRIAAIGLLVLCSGVVLYSVLKPGKPNMLTFQTGDKVRIDTLADGSIITLNKNSSLTYPDRFNSDTREISLNRGEAFFDVAHDKSKPFIIHVNDISVKVVGTSFNIKTAGTQTNVIVETGIVQVIRKKVVIRLKPKEQVTVDSGAGKITKSQSTDLLYNYYRTKTFVPNKTPLWRFVQILNEVYHVNIVIANPKVAQQLLTSTFKTDSLDFILGIIKDTFHVQIIHKPNQIIIK